MMETFLLQMGKSQMVKGWSSIRFDDYKEILGSTFHSQIKSLYDNLSSTDVLDIDPGDYNEYRDNYELLKDWITLLNYNHINDYPQELVYTLKHVVKEWLNDWNKYIILISDNPYQVTYPPMDLDAKYQNIEIRYGLKIEHKVIKISMPKVYCDDYLVNVCLYHEIGHFVDRQKNLRVDMAYNIIKSANKNVNVLLQFQHYLPFLKGTVDFNKVVSHVCEYIADIFAAQYVDDGILMYLKYLNSACMDVEGEKHPSTNLRIEMVEDFLNGKKTAFLVLLDALMPVYYNGQKLGKRYHNNHIPNMLSQNRLTINSVIDLHSLYANGWMMYKMNKDDRETNHPATQGFHIEHLYENINKCIGEAVNAYMNENPI